MLLCRYARAGATGFGILEGDAIQPVQGELLPDATKPAGPPLRLSECRLLAPARGRIFAVGQNYRAHAREMGKPLPEEPLFFMKADSALLDPGGTILLPPESREVHHEAELALIVSQTARRVTEREARGYLLGFTCLNDVTARDIQRKEVQFTRAKSFDTFAPMGPAVDIDLDRLDRRIQCRVNGQTRQDSRTSDMIFNPFKLLSSLSQGITLRPGDVISTGTPAGVGPLAPGDVVEVEIEGIGILRNPVAAEGTP